MIIVSQDKEKVLWFGRAFNALQYAEDYSQGKKTLRHTICISDGCLEEIAEYESKERCLEVMKEFCQAHEKEVYTSEYFDEAARATVPAICMQNITFEMPEK